MDPGRGPIVEDWLAREAVRATLASCSVAGDSNEAERYAAAFAEDGVIAGAAFCVAGRDRIRDWKAARAQASPARVVRHNLTTSHIELTGPDAALARSYFVVCTEVGPDHCGWYSDLLRRDGERWLIARREVRVDWYAPDSRFRHGREVTPPR